MNHNFEEDIDNLNVPQEFVEIASLLKLHKKEIRGKLSQLLHVNFAENDEESKLQLMKIIEYSIYSNSQYWRSFFLKILGEALGLNKTKSLFIGSVIEMLHNYVVMQSSLQCIENNDFYNGQEASHKKFGNAETIIASNVLINLIISTIINDNLIKIQNNTKCNLIKILTKCIGKDGINGGMMMKVIFKKKQKCSQSENVRIKKLKINSIFVAGAECIELLAGKNDVNQDMLIKGYINNYCNLINLYDEFNANLNLRKENFFKKANSFTAQGCKSISKIENNERLISFIKYKNYCIQKTINREDVSKPIVCKSDLTASA